MAHPVTHPHTIVHEIVGEPKGDDQFQLAVDILGTLVIAVILFLLVSGHFPYKLLALGSGFILLALGIALVVLGMEYKNNLDAAHVLAAMVLGWTAIIFSTTDLIARIFQRFVVSIT